jgi:aspartyl-tRNA(Asn)/glutamyl-tRNA(Gln) amidotransferase subunit C
MSSLSKDDVEKLAKLARLELSPAEIEKYQKEFSEILSYVDQLSSVNTESLNPTYQVTGLKTVTRPDEVLDYGTTQEDLFKNVPTTKDSQIQVKRMLS